MAFFPVDKVENVTVHGGIKSDPARPDFRRLKRLSRGLEPQTIFHKNQNATPAVVLDDLSTLSKQTESFDFWITEVIENQPLQNGLADDSRRSTKPWADGDAKYN